MTVMAKNNIVTMGLFPLGEDPRYFNELISLDSMASTSGKIRL